MRAISNAVMGVVLLAALALAGCGSGDSNARSASAAAIARLRTITLTSTAVAGGSTAAVGRGTCSGRNISIPLSWNPVPAGTQELLLVMLSLKPVAKVSGKIRVSATPQWAAAGLSPSVRRIASGRLPRGAILGRNADGSSRYPVCPARGQQGLYAIMVFASPRKLSPRSGFSDDAMWADLSRTRPPYGQLLVAFSHA